MSDNKITDWPSLPYKGLSYYGPQDRAIFAGRDANIVPCARLLGASSTRILILYGRTGCGKSSFLRAGLIPFLESPERGFKFLKEGASQAKSLFVRSTDAPLVKLAEEIHKFAKTRYEVQTPEGPRELDLSPILLEYKELQSFRESVGTNLDLMMKSLSELAYLVPLTLVLVIDQAEEVLTMTSGTEGYRLRNQFFDFLAKFSKSKIDLKLIIAIRSEFHGDFTDEIQRREWDTSNIREYMLKDLSEAEAVEAIKRPTLGSPVDHFGVPYDHYHFKYSDGLPETIAKELERTTPQGGKLPILQIVCDRLYKQKKREVGEDKEFEITEDDYRKLGGVEGQLVAHLKDVLTELCKRNGLSTLLRQRLEITAWVKVFRKLWRSQPDGTVVKELAAVEGLENEAKACRCQIKFDDAMEFLQGGERRVVTRVDVLNVQTNQTVHCYTLGHDAIGVALKLWPEEEARQITEVALRSRNAIRFGGVVQIATGLLFLLPYFLDLQFGGTALKVFGLIIVGYGLLFVLSPQVFESFRIIFGPYKKE